MAGGQRGTEEEGAEAEIVKIDFTMQILFIVVHTFRIIDKIFSASASCSEIQFSKILWDKMFQKIYMKILTSF